VRALHAVLKCRATVVTPRASCVAPCRYLVAARCLFNVDDLLQAEAAYFSAVFCKLDVAAEARRFAACARFRRRLAASHAVLCCAVLCCAVLCCAVLCCAVLCCAVLCCAVLCCAVLCCATWYRRLGDFLWHHRQLLQEVFLRAVSPQGLSLTENVEPAAVWCRRGSTTLSFVPISDQRCMSEAQFWEFAVSSGFVTRVFNRAAVNAVWTNLMRPPPADDPTASVPSTR
jgi:hypothetical protein